MRSQRNLPLSSSSSSEPPSRVVPKTMPAESFLTRVGLQAPTLSKEDRTVWANNYAANMGFADNVIITSKYTWYNFVPLFLLNAFTRLANAYFLMVCVLQSIPIISITNGVPTSALPLGIVLLFDGTATAREDYKRHVDDAAANNSKTLVVRSGQLIEVAWAGIVVGDLIKISRNSAVPADCVFLASSTQESDTPDTCYVQTAQLDGETNLKLRTAARQSAEYFTSDQACLGFRGCIRCEAPNAAFDKFAGTLQLSEGAAAIPLEAENLLLRGSVLRNVDFAYAMVVYTGRETKVRVRQTTRKTKFAQVETQLNYMILFLICFLLGLCVVGTVGIALHTQVNHSGQWYFGPKREALSARAVVEQFFTFFLLNASFIPVSLYVTVRLARTLQVFFMEADTLMEHRDEEQLRQSLGAEGVYPFKVRSMELNDELGQVTHIFSDKTGTLTLNYMEWRKVMVGGVAYGLGTTQIGIDRLRRAGQDVSHLEGAMQAEKLRGRERGAQLPHVNFEDGCEGASEAAVGRTLGSDARNPCDGAQGTAIHDMLLHLSLNHTVLPEVVRDAHGEVMGSKLSASSPDEEAFCYAAETLGYKFLSRTQESVCLNIRHAAAQLPLVRYSGLFSEDTKARSARLKLGVRSGAPVGAPAQGGKGGGGGGGAAAAAAAGSELPFGILHILAYTQERKCMSVVVEHPVLDAGGAACVLGAGHASGQRGDIYLYCKGADSAILPKCAPPATAEAEAALRRSKATLQDWGNDGLRTLVFAQRRLPREAYEAWAVRYSEACRDLTQLKLKKDKRPNTIDELQTELEVGLTLQGATANEDKLQPEVPETLSLLAQAGIKLWMVTGDKQETAVNIGFATKLLDTSQRQIVVTSESAGGVLQAMRRLRIAAKRIRLEAEAKARESREHAGYGPTEQVMQWITRRLVAAESGAGASGAAGAAAQHHSLAVEGETSGGVSPRPASATPRYRTNSAVSPFPASGLSAVELPARRGPRLSVGSSKGGAVASPGQQQQQQQPGGTIVSPMQQQSQYDSDEDEDTLAEGAGVDAAIGIDSAFGSPGSSTEHQHLLAGGASSSSSSPQQASIGISGRSVDEPLFPMQVSVRGLAEGAATATPLSPLQPPSSTPAASHRPFALVIDEHCLDAALSDARQRTYLLFVAVNCDAVIACRARPDQKARLVRLIRDGLPSARTLAVGDGANDVDMIGAAHVGVGIAGAEGVQAANASDFSIGRFRFLQRLLLVHGRWNYSRMARVVLYMFWKNILFVLCQFIYQIQTNGFSGQKWYVEYAAQAFNLVFTGAAPLVLGVLDRDLDAPWALRYPKLYDFGRLAQALTLPVFFSWMGDALVSAVLVYFFTVHGFPVPDYASGTPGGGATPFVFSMGTMAYTSIVVAANLRIAAEAYHHSTLFQAIVALSVVLWVPVCFLLDALRQDGMYGGMRFLFGSANLWLLTLLVSGALGLRMLLWKGWKRMFSPDLRHCVQEVAALGLSSRSIDSYCDSADLGRRLGKSVAEIIRAQKAASLAAEALQPLDSRLLQSPARAGSSSSARVDHFGSSPLLVPQGTSDPTEGGYAALGAGPHGGGLGGAGSISSSSSSSSSSSALGGGGGGGGDPSTFNPAAKGLAASLSMASVPSTPGLAGQGSLSSLSSSSGGGGGGSSTPFTPLQKGTQQERAARTILEGALRPVAVPGDANFDSERFAGEFEGVESPKDGRLSIGSKGGPAVVASALAAQKEEVKLQDFKATVAASVRRLQDTGSGQGANSSTQ